MPAQETMYRLLQDIYSRPLTMACLTPLADLIKNALAEYQAEQKTTTCDEQATTLIMRYIDSNERAEDICCQIITRAYEDAAHMRRSDPDPVDFYTPRTDAGDAIQSYFDDQNPLAADRRFMNVDDVIVTAGLFDSLILYALDRVDWYAIVDHLRERMHGEDHGEDKALSSL